VDPGGRLSFVDGRLIVTAVGIQAAGMVASYLLGKTPDLRQAQVGLAIVIACAVIIVSNDPNRTSSEFVFVPALFVVAWVAGFVLRQRTEQSEEAREHAARLELEQQEQVRKTIAEERARIARELHDVVGHCVSVMTVQASGVRRMLAAEQSQEREALMALERVGREALGEMRRLVGVLRYPSPDLAPQPTIRDLDVLVAHARDSGLSVEVSIEGAPSGLPASIDLTAYRIVQEGLTKRHPACACAQRPRADLLPTEEPRDRDLGRRCGSRRQWSQRRARTARDARTRRRFWWAASGRARP
jgi:signal transduction histidine kinase